MVDDVSLKTRAALLKYVERVCAETDVDFKKIWNLLHGKKPAGQFILRVLGVDDKVLAAHRPRDTERAYAIRTGMDRLLDEGHNESDASKILARRLNISVSGIQKSLTRNPNITAEYWFE